MTLKHPVRYIGKAGYEFLLSLFMLEKPRDFDPFGHAGLSPLVTI